MNQKLLKIVQRMTLRLPLDIVQVMATVLTSCPLDIQPPQLRAKLHNLVHSQRDYQEIGFLVDQMNQANATPSEVGHALLAAAQMNNYHRNRQSIDLLWTGPDTKASPKRQNNQALLEVIHAAKQTLYLVSFAIYNIEGIQTAIEKALNRGVKVNVFMEFPQRDPDTDKLGYNTVRAFGIELAKRCHMYEWQMEKRPYKLVNGKKRYATLHAKIAVADKSQLFISSANLTEYAMLHNIEMGVLITDGDEPGRVREHFQSLIDSGEFILKSEQEVAAFEHIS